MSINFSDFSNPKFGTGPLILHYQCLEDSNIGLSQFAFLNEGIEIYIPDSTGISILQRKLLNINENIILPYLSMQHLANGSKLS